MAQSPLLVRGGLSGAIFVVTRYKVLDRERGHIEAITKYDVTDQFNLLVSDRTESPDLQLIPETDIRDGQVSP